MAKKIYELAVAKTLRTIAPGEQLQFVVAGAGRETTLQSLRTSTAAYDLHLNVRSTNDGLRAVVTNDNTENDN
jgi:hypothetical protein